MPATALLVRRTARRLLDTNLGALASEAYAYDANNNLLSVTETLTAEGGAARTTAYRYDRFDRLIHQT
ncbi:hypothetical protein K8B33_06090, partial [Alcanivorax sp. JB21]